MYNASHKKLNYNSHSLVSYTLKRNLKTISIQGHIGNKRGT